MRPRRSVTHSVACGYCVSFDGARRRAAAHVTRLPLRSARRPPCASTRVASSRSVAPRISAQPARPARFLKSLIVRLPPHAMKAASPRPSAFAARRIARVASGIVRHASLSSSAHRRRRDARQSPYGLRPGIARRRGRRHLDRVARESAGSRAADHVSSAATTAPTDRRQHRRDARRASWASAPPTSARAPAGRSFAASAAIACRCCRTALAALDVSSLSQDHAVTLESVVSQQIEIIKGPAALLYGSGAAGGLVNVVSNRVPTESPQTPISGAVEVRGDTRSRGAHGRAEPRWRRRQRSHSTRTISIARPTTWKFRSLRSRTRCAVRSSKPAKSPTTFAATFRTRRATAQGGALGASMHRRARDGGCRGAATKRTTAFPARKKPFIDMKQDRFDAQGEDSTRRRAQRAAPERRVQRLHAHRIRSARRTRHGIQSGRLRAALRRRSRVGRAGAARSARSTSISISQPSAMKPSCRLEDARRPALFAFEERHFDRLDARARCARRESEDRRRTRRADLPDYDETAVSLSAGMRVEVRG